MVIVTTAQTITPGSSNPKTIMTVAIHQPEPLPQANVVVVVMANLG